MTSLSGNSEYNYQPRDAEPTFDEIIAEFDAADMRMRMALSCYFDQPTPSNMRTIISCSEDSFDTFGEVLRKMQHDATGVVDEESRPAILATLLHSMSNDHSQLLAEYTDFISLPTDEERVVALEGLMSHFEHLDTFKELIDAALDNFREIRDDDMEAIEQFTMRREASPAVRIKDAFVRGSLEATKIGAGVMIGLFAYDRLRKK